MTEILVVVVFMILVVGLAAGVLWLIDRRTLSRRTSAEERGAFVARRTARWQYNYRKIFAILAIVSIPINLVPIVTKSEPLMPNAFYIALAVVFLLGNWNALRKGDGA